MSENEIESDGGSGQIRGRTRPMQSADNYVSDTSTDLPVEGFYYFVSPLKENSS